MTTMTDPQQPYDRQYHPYAKQGYDPQPYPTSAPYAQQQQPAAHGQQPYDAIAPYQGGYGQPGYPPGGYPQPGYGPLVGYGVDPATGLPLSDKSKIAAGLLQLFIGGFGVGRFYLGYGMIGGLQLGIHVIGWFFFFLGFVTFGVGMLIAVLFWMGGGVWALTDAIMMLTGSVRDADGRVLRS